MGGFYGLRLQGVAQSVRHDLRIAKIAHQSTSSSANGEDRSLHCRPIRQWRGRGDKGIRSPSPKGAGGRCINLVAIWRAVRRDVNRKRGRLTEWACEEIGVMPALVAGIHVFLAAPSPPSPASWGGKGGGRRGWPGQSPAMTSFLHTLECGRRIYCPPIVRTTLSVGLFSDIVGNLFSLRTASSYCGSVVSVSFGTMCTTLKPFFWSSPRICGNAAAVPFWKSCIRMMPLPSLLSLPTRDLVSSSGFLILKSKESMSVEKLAMFRPPR